MSRPTLKILKTPVARIKSPHFPDVEITVDPVAQVIYVKVSESEIAKTKEDPRGILLDLDRRGRLVGISILRPQRVSLERHEFLRTIARRFHAPSIAAIRPEYLAKAYQPEYGYA